MTTTAAVTPLPLTVELAGLAVDGADVERIGSLEQRPDGTITFRSYAGPVQRWLCAEAFACAVLFDYERGGFDDREREGYDPIGSDRVVTVDALLILAN